MAAHAQRRGGRERRDAPTPLLALAAFVRSRAGRRGAAARTSSRSPARAAGSRCTPRYRRARQPARWRSSWSAPPAPQTTAVRLEAHGVTAREREIAALLAQGLSNAEIATALVLSPYTVQDHIKSLFEKTAVSSRQELVARIFLDQYMPQLVQQGPLTSDGQFAAPPMRRMPSRGGRHRETAGGQSASDSG